MCIHYSSLKFNDFVYMYACACGTQLKHNKIHILAVLV